MLFFEKISFKNFLSYGNTPTVIELNQATTTVLVGPSGAGKSAVTDCLSFGLFNKPFRYINKNDLVNTINQKDCLVEIWFTVDSKKYLIRRGIKPTIFEIYCDGVMLNQEASSRDYQAYLEKQILKFNFRSFSQIIVLGASNFVPFMQLKPADRRLIIEELLDIEIFSTMNVLLKQRITSNKEKIEEIKRNIYLFTEKRKVYETYSASLEDDIEQKVKRNLETIQENKAHLSKFLAGIEEHKRDLEKYRSEITAEKAVLGKIKKLEDAQTKAEFGKAALEKEICFYRDSSNCPKCKQIIAEDFRESEIKGNEEKTRKHKEVLEQITIKLEELKLEKERIELVKKQIRELEFEINKKEASVSAIKDFILKVEQENSDAQKPKDHDVIKTIDQIVKEQAALEKEKEKCVEIHNVYEIAASLLKDNGIKTNIIRQYLPVINKLTNKYLHQMSFYVTVYMDENFEETITDRGRDPRPWGSLSDGEKQRLNLALLFTWREVARMKNSVNTNLLILDEIADSFLDETTTEDILNLLHSNEFSNINMFMISHKTHIADRFMKTLSFKKERNFSVMT